MDGQKKGEKKRLKKPNNPDITDVDKKQANSAYQDLLLGLNLMFADLDDSLKDIDPTYFDGESRQEVAKYILANPATGAQDVPKELLSREDYVKIVLFKTEELYDSWSASDRLIEAVGLAHRLTHDYAQKRKQVITDGIREAEDAGDDTKKEKLLREFNALIQKKD